VSRGRQSRGIVVLQSGESGQGRKKMAPG
jgi:hypothetical protein